MKHALDQGSRDQSEDQILRARAKELSKTLRTPRSSGDRGTEPPKFLERWMASYLAELLAREKTTSGKARNAVRAEIASLVPQLWELQLARDALAVRMRVDWWERRVNEFDDSTAILLRPILDDPGRLLESELE